VTVPVETLLAVLPGARYDGPAGLPLDRLVEDSRAASPGVLFAAVPGRRSDGTRFVPDAIERGAVAILAEVPRPATLSVPWIEVPSVREAVGPAAAELLGRPGDRLRLFAVTGTNGKTTTATLLAGVADAAEGSSGLVGTVEYRVGTVSHRADRTTPEAWRFQALLAEMVEGGIRTAATEASSHALDQGRLSGTLFDVAVFTNLTRDHFDYHVDFENYFRAKRRLFDQLRPGGMAVVNVDDPWGRRLAEELGPRARRYALDADDAVRPRDLRLDLDGIRFGLEVDGETISIQSRLVGRHNVSNLTAAALAARIAGFPVDAVERGLASVSRIPGRLERVDDGGPLPVFVDYAHTEDALARTIASLRELTDRRIVAVFGCGGDKDRGKRAPMGAAVAKLADSAVVTSDNPRSEDPLAIIADIEKGIDGVPGARYVKIPDRRLAIRHAIALAGDNDLVLVAGKGHEDEQVLCDRTIPFSDRDVSREALAARPAPPGGRHA
jgi:UDP-N-acetylmuramoyl-L-alanyl-D-glutamate--2,6-diaminopimelate ligase